MFLLNFNIPGQGGNPPRPAEVDLCWKTAGRWEDLVRLQHPEGVHSSPGPQTQGRKLEAAATIDGREIFLFRMTLFNGKLSVIFTQ